jgi:hypothetical protein
LPVKNGNKYFLSKVVNLGMRKQKQIKLRSSDIPTILTESYFFFGFLSFFVLFLSSDFQAFDEEWSRAP